MKPGQANALVALVAILAVGVLAICGLVIYNHFQTNSQLAHKASNAKVLHALELANQNSCVDQNITHATDNRSHLKDYLFDLSQIRGDVLQIQANEANYLFTKANLHADYVALAKTGISRSLLRRALRESRIQLAQSRAQIASQKRVVRADRADAKGKTWTALVDCKATPRAGTALRVYLISQRRPPKPATEYRNAQRLDPLGSVGG